MIQAMNKRPSHPTKQENLYSKPTMTVGFVSGPPSREHWKPDEKAHECSLCGEKFTMLLRRHHCRKCGDIFCHDCCKKEVLLDQNCNFHPGGFLVRVCNTCSDETDSPIQSTAALPISPPPTTQRNLVNKRSR